MNRRRHPRLDINIPAVIEYKGRLYQACHLLNFSRGGAYLQCPDPHLKAALPEGYYAESERQEALLSVPSESLQVKVHVVYYRNDGLGLACSDADGAQLYEVLHAKLRPQPAAAPGESAGQRIEPGRNRELLKQLRERSLRFLETGLARFFSDAHQALRQEIGQTSDPQDESALFYTLNSLEQHQATLTRRFLELGKQRFAVLLGEPPEPEAKSDGGHAELALVEKQEIDTWILVNEAARRAESEVGRTLYRFEIGLSYLCQENIHNDLNPISPISLLTMLKSVLDDYELKIETIRLVLNAFHNTLLGDIDQLYVELAQLLQQQGVVEQEDQQHGEWTIVTSPAPPVREGSAAGHLAALADLHASQDGEATRQGIASAELEAVQATLASLSSLQGATLQQQIEKLLQATSQPLKLSPEARTAIGAGEELVAELSKDPLITDELRALLGSLKFLIIEAVLQDTGLLDNPQHPVRCLFDAIESLKPYVNTGTHASLIRDRDARRLVMIADAVESGRIEHVDQVTQEIQALLLEQRERFEKNRRLAISRCLKEEKLKQAQIKTYKALSDLLLNRRVPAMVDQLLRFGWVNLLVQKAVIGGKHGNDWQAYLQVVEWLVMLFTEASAPQEITVDQRKVMLSLIHTAFTEYPVHPDGAHQFEQLLGQALDGDESSLSQQQFKVDRTYLQRYFSGMCIAQETAALETVDSEWGKTVDNLALDTWLLEQSDQGKLRMLSLAWKNPAIHRYLLVDGHGFKALDEDFQQLTSRFTAQQITPMKEPVLPVVERTIESILANSYDGSKLESSIDPLTGLSNRRAFEAELRNRLNEQQTCQLPHTLLLLDLDRFQVVNDLCGFEGGDRLLQTVTDILLSYLPEAGFLARIGDDEFCLLLMDHDLEQGYQTAETLRMAIDDYAFEWQGRMIPSSASVGIVSLESTDQAPGEMMQSALAACNMAKEGGGNCSRIYLASDTAYQDHQQLIRSLPDIKEALAKGRMELYVQPIVPLYEAKGLSPHHEVLLRIRNAEGELQSPQEFVRAAEQYDMMRAVDRWVVNAFLDTVEPYADKLPKGQSFSINLSGKSVGDSEFRQFLKERIQSTCLQTNHLGFEITETALVGDISDTATFIEEIRKLGCHFSLDDFGSGYASFSYLKDFPVDFVKIDGIFVRQILDKPADYAMINTITEIAHFMDKRVVAEFVSDPEIAQALSNIGVDFGQGYHFDKPRSLKLVLSEIVSDSEGKRLTNT
jgi:diguanylate cyclase (GGDEF)-like protein